jgi:phospholipid/cholesterol/gamma-HCH transport system ATP-binding protein
MSFMKPVLEIKDLKKSFGAKMVHQGITLQINKAETVGLLGNSGTGKSVLLRCVIGLETMDDGEVWFNNQRIDLFEEEELFQIRTKISYAFQSGALFDSLSVYENIAYPVREHLKLKPVDEESKVKDVLKLVRLEEASELYPSDLSGGMQKRAGLARAMILSPEIILYDEPTAGLDPINVDNVLDIMKNFKSRGIAGIFVTHDIPAAKKVCDRLLLIHNGRIHFSGTVEEFESSQDPVVKNFPMSH